MSKPRFIPHSLTLSGRVRTAAPVEEVFPLFSPEGERAWVPGWDPELLHPAGETWTHGQVFRTRGRDGGEVTWVVSRLDREGHRAGYHRVEPGRHVAHVQVQCRAVDEGTTETSVSYTYVGLSDAGNDEIAAMTQPDHEARMTQWTGWIDTYFAQRGKDGKDG